MSPVGKIDKIKHDYDVYPHESDMHIYFFRVIMLFMVEHTPGCHRESLA